MKPRKLIIVFALISIILISGCNIPVAPLIPDIPEGATPSSTGTSPFPPTNTPTITPSLTAAKLTLTVSHATYCRTGPGTAYDLLGTLPVGVEAEVIGQNVYHDTWVIKFPASPSFTCWLWGNYATLNGDATLVPVIQTPPTPTPKPDFTFSYRFWGIGPGFQCIYFDVESTGATTWQSYSLQLHNVTHGENGSFSGDTFVNYDGWCLPISTQADLAAGETGTASVVMHMLYDFSGDTFDATLTLCSSDGLGGYCLTKTLTYVP